MARKSRRIRSLRKSENAPPEKTAPKAPAKPKLVRTARPNASPVAAPTAERLAKGQSIVRVETITAGATVPVNQEECLLDRLYRAGWLGPPERDPARRRLEAGLWLRRLYIVTHDVAEGVWRYRDGGRDQSEMTDRQAWNHKCYLDTARALGRHWRNLEKACCFDHLPFRARSRGDPRIADLQDALDALADHRGM